MNNINTFDIDGVIYMGEYGGVYPGLNDIIITGRSFEESDETIWMLNKKGIHNKVMFNQLSFDNKSRESSGIHKGNTILKLEEQGYKIGIHFEDDPIQIAEIKKIVPHVKIVYMQHDLIEKENVRHTKDTE